MKYPAFKIVPLLVLYCSITQSTILVLSLPLYINCPIVRLEDRGSALCLEASGGCRVQKTKITVIGSCANQRLSHVVISSASFASPVSCLSSNVLVYVHQHVLSEIYHSSLFQEEPG